MYQNQMDYINSANPQNNVTNITKVRSKLTEQRISPHDLVEFDAESYKEMKNQGLTIDQMKERTHKQFDKDDINFDVAFVAPKCENYSKKGVFLPEKNQSYNSLTNNTTFQKNTAQNFTSPNQMFQQQTTQVRSTPQNYNVQTSQQNYYVQQPVRVSQNNRVSQNVNTTSGSKIVKRIYKNQYGEIVNVEEQKYF